MENTKSSDTLYKIVRVRKKDGTIVKKRVRVDENGNIIKVAKPAEKPAASGASAAAPKPAMETPKADVGASKPAEKPVTYAPVREVGGDAEKMEDATEKREEKADGANAINAGVTSKTAPMTADNGGAGNASSLRARVLNRHAFVSNLERGESASSASSLREEVQVTKPLETEVMEEAIEPDNSVGDLEKSVLATTYRESVGKGSGKGVSAGATSYAGKEKAINPLEKERADERTRNSLAGSYVAKTALPEVQKAKPKKERRPVKSGLLVGLGVALVAVLYVAVFLLTYNFGDKKVHFVEYTLTTAETAVTKYQDGAQLNLNGINFCYNYDNNESKNVALSLVNLEAPSADAGYKIVNGYVVADWSGDFSGSDRRNITLRFFSGTEHAPLNVTIFRNKVVSLKSLSVLPTSTVYDGTAYVTGLNANAEFYLDVFGVCKVHDEVGGENFETLIDKSAYKVLIKKVGETNYEELVATDGKYKIASSDTVVGVKVVYETEYDGRVELNLI